MTKLKAKTYNKSVLCPKCEGIIFGLLDELKAEAKKSNRCGIVLDSIGDLEVSLIEGSIKSVKNRDEAWRLGNRNIGRRFVIKRE